MPFVDGESLRDRLNREKQLAVEEAVRIAREVLDALAYAHGLGPVPGRDQDHGQPPASAYLAAA